jgi:hypothetical protein
MSFNPSHAGTVVTATTIEHASGTGTETISGKVFLSDTDVRDLLTDSVMLPAGSAAGTLSLTQPTKISDGSYEIDWTYPATDAQIATYI